MTARASRSRRCPTRTRTPSSAPCAGVAERPGRRGATTTSGRWRTAMFAPGRRARPGDDARGRARRLPRDARRRLRRGRRVPLRPSPARRHAVRGARTRWRIAVAEAARRGRAGDRAAARRLSPRRLGRRATCRRTAASGASATRTSRRSWRASTRCAPGRRGVPGVARRHRRAQRPRGPARAGSRRSPRTPSAHGLVRHVHASEQRARARRVRGRARLLADRAAAPHRLPRPAHERDPRDPRLPPPTSPGSPRVGTIVVTCPTTEGNLGDGYLPAMAYREAGVRLAIGSATRRCASTRSRRCASSRRCARRERRPLRAAGRRAATCGRELAADGRAASLGIEDDVRAVAIDPAHPQLAGIPEADLPRCAGHQRVRRGRGRARRTGGLTGRFLPCRAACLSPSSSASSSPSSPRWARWSASSSSTAARSQAPPVEWRRPLHSTIALFRSPIYTIGCVVATTSWGFHVAALGLAPISRRAVGDRRRPRAVTVVADRVFGQSVTRREWIGVGAHRRRARLPRRHARGHGRLRARRLRATPMLLA